MPAVYLKTVSSIHSLVCKKKLYKYFFCLITISYSRTMTLLFQMISVTKQEFEVSQIGHLLVEFSQPFSCSEIFSICQWHFLFLKGLLYVVGQSPITA